jgi:cytochrome P450
MSIDLAQLPPGPSQSPLVQTVRWLFSPISFMESCRRKYGDAFSVTFLGFETPMVMLSDPAAIAGVFKERRNGLPPGRSVSLEPILGSRSVLLLEGSEHLARRKLMLPPFHGERMRAYQEVVDEVVAAEINSWWDGASFPVHPRMQAITLEVILRAVFGVSDEARRARLRVLLGGLLGDTAGPGLQLRFLLSRRIPWMSDPLAELRKRLEETDALLFAEIAECREDPNLEEREDILAMLVAARFEDGEPIDDREIRDQLMTLLLAGHETTATALAWTFDLLLRNPDKLARLRADLDAGSEDYLRATISESLRLRPVVPLAGRRLAETLELDGYTLPPGTDVTPAIWLAHTREQSYPDARSFKPERFLDSKPDTYAWVPFGGGVRRCLGAAFAEFEMRIVLRTVLERCEIAGTRTRPQGIARRNVTFSPKNGTPIVVRHRRPAAKPATVAA